MAQPAGHAHPQGRARPPRAARPTRPPASAGCCSAPSSPPTSATSTRTSCPTCTGSSARSTGAQRVVQPRLRHRYQVDRHGLARSTHQLSVTARPSASPSTTTARRSSRSWVPSTPPSGWSRRSATSVSRVLHRAMRWSGPVGPSLVTYLTGVDGARASSLAAFANPVAWALDVLGFEPGTVRPAPPRRHGPVPAPPAGGPPRPRRRRGHRRQAHQRPRRGSPHPELREGRGRCSWHPARAPTGTSPPSSPSSGRWRPLPVARIDFPYRKAGRRAPDRAPVLVECVREEAAALVARAGIRPGRLALGGRSMGGRMCSMAVAEGLPATGVGPGQLSAAPTRAARPASRRAPAGASPCRCLFVHGTRDPFGTPDELRGRDRHDPRTGHPRLDRRRSPRPKGADAKVASAASTFLRSLR